MFFTKCIPVAFVVFSLASAKPASRISLEVTLQNDESHDLASASPPTTFELSHQLSVISEKATQVSRTSIWFKGDGPPFLPNAIEEDLQAQLKEIAAAIKISEKYVWQDHGYFWDTHHALSNAVIIQSKVIELIAQDLGQRQAAGGIKDRLVEIKDSLKRLEDPLIEMMPKCADGKHEQCKDQGYSDSGYMLQALGFAIDTLNRNMRAEDAAEL